MENVRTRDFIYTTDELYFASTNYIHPKNRYISFLRYIPDPHGDREKNGKKYRKVNSKEAYEYLNKNYPEYLYDCNITNIQMMGVPLNKVKKILRPQNRLKAIRDTIKKGGKLKNPELSSKLYDLSDFFYYVAGIDYEHLGISGSILPGLHQKDTSDLDFVIYGLKNHRKAISAFKKNRGKEVYIPEINKKIQLNKIEDKFWDFLYDKRMKDSSLTKDEFKWYENRKANRGTIDGVLFDILATKDYNEISGRWGDTIYEPLGTSTIQCQIKSALAAFDNPASYTIENLKIIEGIDVPISEIVSFTHTYAGQAVDGEEVIAKGKVEKIIKDKNPDSYRLVVGTSRESIDEYIKLKESPI